MSVNRKLLLVISIMLSNVAASQVGQEIKDIWSSLIIASGNTLDFPPHLAITEKDTYGPAYFSKAANTVYLLDGLQDTLALYLGEDTAEIGLAYVLAHELAHAADGHVASHFAKRNIRGTSASSVQRNSRNQFKLVDESKADRLAGIYTHILGLDCFEVAPSTLDVIYTAYAIPDTIPGYPTLDEEDIGTKCF